MFPRDQGATQPGRRTGTYHDESNSPGDAGDPRRLRLAGGNASTTPSRLARKPNFDRLWATCPHAFLRTSGPDVGLPDGQMGNSEVGHLNIGAGRVVMQDLPRISQAVADGTIARAPALRSLIDKLKASGGTCHLLGLVSPGGVHSHQDHAAALAGLLHAAGIRTVLHAFTDGRDTPPQSGRDDLARLAAALPKDVPIATVSGRYYAMDRDKRWDRVSKAYARWRRPTARIRRLRRSRDGDAYAQTHRRVRRPRA